MKMFLIFLFSLVMLLCGCSPVETAGGVSEETNSVSGVLVAADGNFARNVVIHARHSAKSDQLFVDTTDENGAFGFSIKEYGEYVLSSHKAGQAIYETFVYTGSDLKMSSKMTTRRFRAIWFWMVFPVRRTPRSEFRARIGFLL